MTRRGAEEGAMGAMSREERAALRRLEQEATRGPWEAPLKNLGAIPSFAALDFYFDESYEAYPPMGEAGPVFVAPTPAIAALMVALRNALPRLLDALDAADAMAACASRVAVALNVMADSREAAMAVALESVVAAYRAHVAGQGGAG